MEEPEALTLIMLKGTCEQWFCFRFSEVKNQPLSKRERQSKKVGAS